MHEIIRRPRRSPVRFLIACLLAGFAAAGCLPAASGLPAATDPVHETVDAYLSEQLAAIGVPGAAVVVIKDGRQVHQAAFGRADESGRPMTVQTPVLLASASKSLTAIAVMQQVEAGRLELDEPLVSYLPWFSLEDPRYAEITVRHLLHQSSGLSTADGSGFEAWDTQATGAIEQGVRDLASASLVAAPGEAFTYSNDNYNVLGLLVQTVAGQPFGDYVEEQVFAPLGMVHSHTTRTAARADNLATGHALWFSTFWLPTRTPAPTTGMPSISLYASAEDIGRELTALLAGGRYQDRRILRPGSVATLLEPGIRVDAMQEYAMGWFARPLVESVSTTAPPAAGAGLPLLLEHQGEWGNTHIYQAMVPDSGLGVALVMNGSDTSAPSRLKAIDRNVLRILHGQAPAPVQLLEDPLQRYGWAAALGLLLAELASLAVSLAVIRRTRPAAATWRVAVLAAAVLLLDVLIVWLCLVQVPAQFAVPLISIVRQIPDIGITLVPALALAILWPVPRTVLLFRRRNPAADMQSHLPHQTNV
jgi:CubicO group peptidase (beta-lactamase class C family)